MATSERELLKRSRRGDQDAFTELMRRHEDKVYALCYRMMGNRPDALDAVQDTFVSVFRRAEDFRGDSAFSTWTYRIAVNACKDLLRKRGRTPVPHEELPEPPATKAGVEDQVVLRTDLARALAELPDDYREAVVMYDLGGIPYEEIARLTDAAIGTVKSRISRGRRKLAELMEQPAAQASSKEQT